jgi:uncharacterized RDD family membrane protein YckC
MDKDYFADAYSPPGSDVNAGVKGGGQGFELAERGTRLWAITIDGLLVSIPLLPTLVLGVYLGVRTQMDAMQAGVADSPANPRAFGLGGDEMMLVLGGIAIFGCLGALAIAIYQWVLISRTGQSLGKKWTGIRIEHVGGERMSFVIGVLLRNWVPKLIGGVPYLGMIFSLIDCLYIFRDDRRCIHDHIAGTRVVRQQR